MTQTNLKITDNFCGFNSESSQFFYTMMPFQYSNTYVWGEVGINSSGGGPGSYVRPDVVDVDSFLSGRDDILSRCNPPVPSLDDVAQTPMVMQNNDNASLLVSKYTKEKKSAVDLSAIDYNRWSPNLPVDPQDLRFVIEDFSAMRGGLDTQNYSKLAWAPTIARGAAVNGNPNSCKTTLDPSRACGPYCADVNGYMPNVIASSYLEKPQPNYPFRGITSQQVKAVGATACGEQQFYGYNYELGNCGASPPQTVLKYNDPMALERMGYANAQ